MGGSCSFLKRKRNESEDSAHTTRASSSVNAKEDQRTCSHHRYSIVDDDPDPDPADNVGIASAPDVNSPSSTRKPIGPSSADESRAENNTFCRTNHEGMKESGLKGVGEQSRSSILRRSSRKFSRNKSLPKTSSFQPSSTSTPCTSCHSSPPVSLQTLNSGLISLSTAVQGNSARLAAIQDTLYVTACESPGQHSPPSPAAQSSKRLKLSLSTTSTTKPPCSRCPGECSHACHDDTSTTPTSPCPPRLNWQMAFHPQCRRNLLPALDEASEEAVTKEFTANQDTVSGPEQCPPLPDKEDD